MTNNEGKCAHAHEKICMHLCCSQPLIPCPTCQGIGFISIADKTSHARFYIPRVPPLMLFFNRPNPFYPPIFYPIPYPTKTCCTNQLRPETCPCWHEDDKNHQKEFPQPDTRREESNQEPEAEAQFIKEEDGKASEKGDAPNISLKQEITDRYEDKRYEQNLLNFGGGDPGVKCDEFTEKKAREIHEKDETVETEVIHKEEMKEVKDDNQKLCSEQKAWNNQELIVNMVDSEEDDSDMEKILDELDDGQIIEVEDRDKYEEKFEIITDEEDQDKMAGGRSRCSTIEEDQEDLTLELKRDLSWEVLGINKEYDLDLISQSIESSVNSFHLNDLPEELQEGDYTDTKEKLEVEVEEKFEMRKIVKVVEAAAQVPQDLLFVENEVKFEDAVLLSIPIDLEESLRSVEAESQCFCGTINCKCGDLKLIEINGAKETIIWVDNKARKEAQETETGKTNTALRRIRKDLNLQKVISKDSITMKKESPNSKSREIPTGKTNLVDVRGESKTFFEREKSASSLKIREIKSFKEKKSVQPANGRRWNY